MVEGWKTLHQEYKITGVAPNTYVLDNETSLELKMLSKTKNFNIS